MRDSIRRLTILALIATTCVMAGMVHAQQTRYEVTITNLTRGQIFAPPLAVVHAPSMSLFEAGQPASEPLRYLAEDGMTGPLVDALASNPAVRGLAAGDGPVLPGSSITIEISADAGRSVITVLGMLVTTNDGFFAANSIPAPNYVIPGLQDRSPLGSVHASVWDAGTETNSESCSEIPGPPCGNGGVRNTSDAEGYVHIHAGLAGQGDLDPAAHDWNNPAALIQIRRLQ